MLNYDGDEHVNIGSGTDISIYDLAHLVKNIIGYKGTLKFNADKPDGTPRKLLDVSKINSLGWKHSILLEEGISRVVDALGKQAFSFAKSE